MGSITNAKSAVMGLNYSSHSGAIRVSIISVKKSNQEHMIVLNARKDMG